MTDTTPYSHNASKWFNDRHLKAVGIKHKLIAFHSFRHTVIDQLKQAHTEEPIIKAIVGHKNESITTAIYGNPYSPESLKPTVESLDFEMPAYTFKLKGRDMRHAE